MTPEATKLRIDQDVTIHFLDSEVETKGTVEFISPVTDAESGTVRVKIRIDNPDGKYRSGERCTLEFSGSPGLTDSYLGATSSRR